MKIYVKNLIFIELNNSSYKPDRYIYLDSNILGSQAMETALAIMDLFATPAITSGEWFNYKEAILKMTNHLKL